ncbi:MAG: ribosome biogenesis GTP-binding protein YihA/YsxC [Actinomycetota bacterium]|nr:ribosome biogenesis GTP-binding protein YihA/YsxC [Actinomycetota bacterium]
MATRMTLRFVQSADDLTQLPDSSAELAFVGRSNVGKSSLLNALGAQKTLARVSKTPGRTRLLNLFEVDGGGTIVDCPGYGYASASAKIRASWQKTMERYLLERQQLVMILVLVDGEIGPTPLDLQMLEWLRSYDRPHTVIATKHDKVRSSARDRRKRELAAGCDVAPSEIVWVSAAKNVGLDRLRELARSWLSLDAGGRPTRWER